MTIAHCKKSSLYIFKIKSDFFFKLLPCDLQTNDRPIKFTAHSSVNNGRKKDIFSFLRVLCKTLFIIRPPHPPPITSHHFAFSCYFSITCLCVKAFMLKTTFSSVSPHSLFIPFKTNTIQYANHQCCERNWQKTLTTSSQSTLNNTTEGCLLVLLISG